MTYTDHIGGANPPPPLSNTDQMAYKDHGEFIHCADGSMYFCPGRLAQLSKVNLASCAARRASSAVPQRLFDDEYDTCKSWTLRSFALY